MQVREAAIPPHIEAQLEDLAPEIVEYLELDETESFSPDTIICTTYFVVDERAGIAVFEYPSNDGSVLALIEYSPEASGDEGGCLSSWPRTPGKSIRWSIEEYLRHNPLS